MVPVNNLDSMNENISFDLSTCLDVFFDNNNDLSTGENILEKNDINCKYYDEQSLINSLSTCKLPLAISINIQRLSSKFDKLQELISTFESNKVYFDVLAIQETWGIKDLKSLSLQSYHDLVFKSRSLSRGGGIGFYINKNLKLKLLMNIQLLMNASLNLFVLKLSSLKINLLFSCLYIDLLLIIFCLTLSNLQLFLKL